jgi:RNA polymerase sigma-70 factor (ECF subfamily)
MSGEGRDTEAGLRPENQEGFSSIFRALAPRLRGFFSRRGASVSQAEELTQDVMLSVWRHAETYDRARGSLGAWVFTLARNRHIDACRRAARPEPDPADPCFAAPAPSTPDASLEHARRRDQVRSALGSLNDEQRATLELLYFEGLTMAEIATREGVPLGTVKSRARRALAALRGALGEGELGEGAADER